MNQTPIVTTTIDLLRHGEPVGGQRYRGQVDDPLSDLGWQQMRSAIVEDDSWDQIVTSPLQRCQAFADELGQQRSIPVSTEKGFLEIGFGCWEGLTRDEIETQYSGALNRFSNDPVNNQPEGAEPLVEFIARVSQAIDQVLERFSGSEILIVAHAGVIRAIVARFLEVSPGSIYRIRIDNAGRSRITIQNPGRTLVEYINR